MKIDRQKVYESYKIEVMCKTYKYEVTGKRVRQEVWKNGRLFSVWEDDLDDVERRSRDIVVPPPYVITPRDIEIARKLQESLNNK